MRTIAFELSRRASAGRRLRPGHRFWGLADQALTSGVSLVTTLIAAAALAVAEFGGFALALTAIYLVNTIQAGIITRPHNQIGAARSPDRYAAYTAATALTQIVFSLLTAVLGLAAMIVAALAFPEYEPLVLALTFAGIAWQAQEFPRRVLYTEARERDAFLNDVVSYGGQVAVLFGLVLLGHLTATSALVAVGVTSAIGAAVGIVQIRGSLTRSFDREAIRDNLALGKWLAAAEAAHWTSTQIYFYIAAVLLGPVAAATIRVTQVLFGPLRIVLMYLYSVLPAGFARTRAREGREALHGEVRRAYAGLIPVLLAYCIPLALLGGPILRLLYGDRYADAAPVVVITAVQYFFVCLIPVVSSLLQVEGLARHLFLAQVYVSVVSIPFGWLLVAGLGVEGAVLGMVFGAVATNAYALAIHFRTRPRTARRAGASVGTNALSGHSPAWTYLFRSGTGFEGRDEELLDGAARLGERRVLVHSHPTPADLAKVDEFHGLVLFGPRRVRPRDLRAAGFVFVRRYGMFPSIAQPRWVIPLDPSFIALAALGALATPYRMRGRVLARGAALLVRAGVPLGAREVIIASRERPPLEVELGRLLDAQPGSIALSSGGAGLRYTPTLVALSASGEPLAFAKLAGSERSRMLIEREAHLLEAIAARPDLRALAPTLIYAGPLDGVYANVQTPLHGAPAPTRFGAAHDRFLAKLEGEPRDAAESSMLSSVRERLPLAGVDAGWLGGIVNRAHDALTGVPLPRTLVHGDFAPFNLRLHGGSLAGFDWENGTQDGLPFIDALHHELQVGFLLKDWDIGRAARSLDRFALERSRAGLSGAQVRALQAVYLLDMYLRRLEGGHGPSSALTSRYAALLHHVSVAEAA